MELIKKANGNIVRTVEEKVKMIDEATEYYGKFLTAIGLVAGITYATLSSSQRFMGLEPNDSEIRRYGSLTKEQVDEYNKISGSIGAELIGKHKLTK